MTAKKAPTRSTLTYRGDPSFSEHYLRPHDPLSDFPSTISHSLPHSLPIHSLPGIGFHLRSHISLLFSWISRSSFDSRCRFAGREGEFQQEIQSATRDDSFSDDSIDSLLPADVHESKCFGMQPRHGIPNLEIAPKIDRRHGVWVRTCASQEAGTQVAKAADGRDVGNKRSRENVFAGRKGRPMIHVFRFTGRSFIRLSFVKCD